jgi:hypothetical protein
MRIKRNRKVQTLTLDLQREKGGRGYGSYLILPRVAITVGAPHGRRAAKTPDPMRGHAVARPHSGPGPKALT